jgi:hypothetical protein
MNQVTRPQNRKEFMNKLIVPYSPEYGNPNVVFSDPQKLGQPEKNRAFDYSLKGDTDKDFSIGLDDLTEAVQYYFDKVLKLSVIQNNTKINVPVIYGTPENWKSVQDDGYYRDQTGKMFAPLIMYKRTSTTPNRGLGNKLDGNKVHNVQIFEKRYNNRNNYGNFTVLAERTPEKEYVVAITPDYVTLEFECMMWTYLVEQMDKLIEILNFSSRSYWGDPNRFQFYSQIETFTDDIAYEIGEDRAVMSRFNLTLNGYLIPDSVNKSVASANRYFGVSKVIFGLETADSAEQFSTNTKKPAAKKLSNVLASDGNNTIIQVNNGGVNPEILSYLNSQKEVTGTFISSNTVNFGLPWAVPPSGAPGLTSENFTFFVNGQFVEPAAISSFVNNATYSTLTLNTTALGYTLEPDDVIVGVGKFA